MRARPDATKARVAHVAPSVLVERVCSSGDCVRVRVSDARTQNEQPNGVQMNTMIIIH